MGLPDFRPSGNVRIAPDVYEIENKAFDRAGLVLAAMRSLAPWRGQHLLDLGCGTGFWLPGYCEEAARVIGVEPDPSLLPRAQERPGGATVLLGSAEHLPLQDQSVDVVHARFAYFFPPGCDTGLIEVMRVLRPGGALVVVDNDQRHGDFAALLQVAQNSSQGCADVTDVWWAERGAERVEVMSSWEFDDRADLEAVLRLEFPSGIADAWLEQHPERTRLSYGYVLYAVTKSRLLEE